MKSTQIMIRTSETLKEEVKQKADTIGLTVSAYLTMLIKKDMKKKKEPV